MKLLQKTVDKRIYKDFFVGLLAFMLARVYIPGGIIPLGLGVFAASLDYKVNSLAIAIGSILGILTTGFNVRSASAILSILFLIAVNMVLPASKKRKPGLSVLLLVLSGLGGSALAVYINGFLLFDFLIAVLQILVSMISYFIFSGVMSIISSWGKERIVTPEELTCAAVTIILCVSGLPEISLFGIGIRNIISIFLLIMFSYKGGFGVGAGIGVIVGLLISESGGGSYGRAVVIALYAYCGFFSGIMNKLGKIGSCIGFVIGNTSLAILLNGSMEVLMPFREIAIAAAVFFIIPDKLIELVKIPERINIDGVITKANYSEEVKRMTVDKLKGFSDSFAALAKTFNEISDKESSADSNDMVQMIDRTAMRVCNGCPLNEYCWEKSFYETYNIFLKIFEGIDNKGYYDIDELPVFMRERCDRAAELIREIKTMYEICKVEVLWRERLAESRELYSEQLTDLSRIIKGLAAEIDVDTRFVKKSEDAIYTELSKTGYRIKSVTCAENKFKKLEVALSFRGCGGKRECVTKMAPLISKIVNKNMTVDKQDNGSDCNYNAGNKICSVRFVEEEHYRVHPGVAFVSKKSADVSGDNYSFMNCGDGKYIAAICDGMGTGRSANVQSKAAIGLLEQFIENGFDKESAVSMINSIFVMKSDDGVFSTLDLLVIDMHNGNAEFIKHGSMPSIIKRTSKDAERNIEIVNSTMLPVGVLADVKPCIMKSSVECGDFIYMMSDGVYDGFRLAGKEQEDMVRFIEESNSINPQELADMLLAESIRLSKTKVSRTVNSSVSEDAPKPDDMLVIVLKVWSKS